MSDEEGGKKEFKKPKGPNDQNLDKQLAERKAFNLRKQAVKEANAEAKRHLKNEVRSEAKKRIRAKRQQQKEYDEQRRQATKVHAELASRERARRKIIPYIKRFDPEYEAGWLHYDICRRLEKFYDDVMAKRAPRLMLFVPPRHGKSYIASDFYPSWCLGKNPKLKFIAASYAVSLPIDFSRNIRDRIKTREYKAVFRHTAISQESKAAEAWKTTQGGAFVAAGVGGGITGKGADIFVIDDPIKDAEEADSEVVRDKIWDWYGSTAYTRMSPGGGMLVIQTRWHDDDLSGRLVLQMQDNIKKQVPEDEFDRWEIIQYPALATHDEWMNPDRTMTEEPTHEKSKKLRNKGDALHPARFSTQLLKRIKNTAQPRHWSALYQQNPVPEEGVYFTKDMFRFEHPHRREGWERMRIFIAGDLAIGEKESNDYTSFAVGGLDYDDQVHILEVIRFRKNTYGIVEALLDLVQKYDPYLVGIEKGQLEHAIKPQLQKRMRERRVFPTLAEGDKALKPVQDKWKRARPLQGRLQQGVVYFPLPEMAPWVETVIHEMLRFPGGLHDDMVDALAWLIRMMINENPPRRPRRKKHKSFRDKLKVTDGRQKDAMAA